MKQKLLTISGALLLATGLSSCYVYDDPLTWGAPCPRPVYAPVYSRPVVYPVRTYGNSGYLPYSSRFNSHCAPRPPSCGPRVGGFGGRGVRGWR